MFGCCNPGGAYPHPAQAFGIGMLQKAYGSLSTRVAVLERAVSVIPPNSTESSVCVAVYEHGTNQFLGNLSKPQGVL